MKVLVFSDSHLSDTFHAGKFAYLAGIIRNADKVIINGDFWEGHTTTFEKFITSPWNELFPLLKERHTVYVYGNHDKKEFSDNRASLFSDEQTNRYELTSGDKKFIFEHGHQYVTIISDEADNQAPNPLFAAFLNRLQRQIVRLRLTKILFKKYNRAVKNKILPQLKPNEIFVCGHTHCAEIDLPHQFINSGLNNFGIGQYVMIEDGMATNGEKWY